MSTALNIPLSLEEFMLRPDREDGQKEELIEGELFVSPAAKVWHAAIVRRLRVKLAPLEELGYIIGNDFACTLGGRSMPAPDLAAVSLERWNHAEDDDGWLEGAPELAVEVASPSNRKLQRKAVLYLEHGAKQVWLIYRKTQTVTMMTSEGTTEARMGETLEFRGVRVTVASFMKKGLSGVIAGTQRLAHLGELVQFPLLLFARGYFFGTETVMLRNIRPPVWSP